MQKIKSGDNNLDYGIGSHKVVPSKNLIECHAMFSTKINSYNFTGIEICEQLYQSDFWNKLRRIVIVRQRIKDRPQAPGKQLRLFLEEGIYRNYRYSAYVTNLKFAPAEIWRLYRERGDAENRIKELKYDFGFDSFNLKDFYATEAALTFAMIAYNLMAFFRTFVLQEKTQKTLSTLRYRTFAIGTYLKN